MGKQVARWLGSSLVTHPTRSGQTSRRPESIGGDEWKTRLASTWLTNGSAGTHRQIPKPPGTGHGHAVTAETSNY
jgi:hypothetical protein